MLLPHRHCQRGRSGFLVTVYTAYVDFVVFEDIFTFSPNGKFLAICYTKRDPEDSSEKAFVRVYKLDVEQGKLDPSDHVEFQEEFGVFDRLSSLTFSSDSSRLIALEFWSNGYGYIKHEWKTSNIGSTSASKLFCDTLQSPMHCCKTRRVFWEHFPDLACVDWNKEPPFLLQDAAPGFFNMARCSHNENDLELECASQCPANPFIFAALLVGIEDDAPENFDSHRVVLSIVGYRNGIVSGPPMAQTIEHNSPRVWSYNALPVIFSYLGFRMVVMWPFGWRITLASRTKRV